MARFYQKRRPIEVLFGHKDAKTGFITPEQGKTADEWFDAYFELRLVNRAGSADDAEKSRERQKVAAEKAAREKAKFGLVTMSVDPLLATAGCSTSDPAGRADLAMDAQIERIAQHRKAADAAQAIDKKLGKGRAVWLADFLEGRWNPTNEGKRMHLRPEKVRQELADTI